MRTFLFKILTSDEFKIYCKEWGKTTSSGLIVIGGRGYRVGKYQACDACAKRYTKETVVVEGKSMFKKTIYQYYGNPSRPWAIEVEVDTGKSYSYKYETFDDLAKKIQKAWRRRSSALTLQRWWKSVYYKPGKGLGYYLAFSSYINKVY